MDPKQFDELKAMIQRVLDAVAAKDGVAEAACAEANAAKEENKKLKAKVDELEKSVETIKKEKEEIEKSSEELVSELAKMGIKVEEK